jgi:hypothetical protein
MFFRVKSVGSYQYLQIVHSIRHGEKVRQQVLALASKEAERFNHNYVGTEHLLLGLINLGQGVAVSVLSKGSPYSEMSNEIISRPRGAFIDGKVDGVFLGSLAKLDLSVALRSPK